MRASVVVLAPALFPGLLFAAPTKYVEDFEFIARTVAEHGAALKTKRIDWTGECARLRPQFESCQDDVGHVKNVMRLLAVLRDSHTDVWRSSVDERALPSMWDGLYGAGLWIAWDRGRLVVMGTMKGHAREGSLPPGTTIVAIDGVPAWLAMEREKRRITEFMGRSSDHALFASIGERLLPFREKWGVPLLVATPGGGPRRVSVARWGPRLGQFNAAAATLPEGVEWKLGATAKLLETPWSKRVGYVRITGGMNDATVPAFHAAFDSLEGMDACLLDCRGMQGGGDLQAWEMAGRFFKGGVANGTNGRIEASGPWQFEGPVVMLQDEREGSSAETFTWAMSETGRVVSVGRPTHGCAIIPETWSCPSGLVDFRLGTYDRPTPIRGVRTEGVGWPPDVPVPYGPVIRSRPDPVREIGLEVLRALHAGTKPEVARSLFGGLLAGRIDEFRKAAEAAPPDEGAARMALARLVEDDLGARLASERELVRLADVGPPDVRGARARLVELAPQAKAAGMDAALAELQAAVKALDAEAAAQEAFLAITDRAFGASEADKKKFLSTYRDSQIAEFAKERYWK
jgi:C-terminal processing protease CtpA/Prc